jgi:predicted transposase YdaD
VDQIPETSQQREVSAYVQLIAGLKYDKETVHRMFRGGIMRESVIYQEIAQENQQIGEERGRQIGEERRRQVGEERGCRSLILQLLVRRMGELSPEVRSQIESCPLGQLEALGEALLDFARLDDLQSWLQEWT